MESVGLGKSKAWKLFACGSQAVGLVLTGFLRASSLELALEQLAVSFGPEAPPRALLLDLAAVDGFEPGLPARIVGWCTQHRERLSALVVVTPSPVLAASLRAASVLLPGLVCESAAHRSAALQIVKKVMGPPRGGKRRTNPTPSTEPLSSSVIASKASS